MIEVERRESMRAMEGYSRQELVKDSQEKAGVMRMQEWEHGLEMDSDEKEVQRLWMEMDHSKG